ncbi:hypothetical protein HK104_001730 [Borealophlyctis nickersoniae]|nr:hypothetical protein HK104_001730 [Borealophlyctis nickersoniae]
MAPSGKPKRKRIPTTESPEKELPPNEPPGEPSSSPPPSPNKKTKSLPGASTPTPPSPTTSGHDLASSMVDASHIGESGLPENLAAPPTDRPVRIYCDGIWDLFHFGHAKALEQAKKVFSEVYLLVGVCGDEVTHTKKGKTVMNEQERYESVRHCKWVDEVIEDAPWVIDQAFLDAHNIDYIAHDDIPYKSGDVDDVYAFVKAAGRFIPTRRTEGVSTSDLITRIVRDYDQYVRRNLERGVSAKELNISFFKEKQIQVSRNMAALTKSLQKQLQERETQLKGKWADTKNDLPPFWRETLEFWEETSSDFVRGFANLYRQEVLPRILFRKRTPSGRSIDSSNASSRSSSPDGSYEEVEADEEPESYNGHDEEEEDQN